jgi:uncharacterized protein
VTRVRILLPPSEAKRPDGKPRGRAGAAGVDETVAGARPVLAEPRAQVAAALVEFCRGNPATAADVLALPARSAASDLAANCAIFDAPTMVALDRYAGIVYDGLDAATLTAAGRRRALESVLVFSGLFGVLRGHERIPVYRLPVAATLPAIGALTPFWRSALPPDMDSVLGDGLIVDLRSSDYRAMWRPTGSIRDRVVSVRVVTEQPGGRLAVISYVSKHGKGRLARALLSSRARITAPEHVAQRWTDAGGRDAIIGPGGAIDLVTPHVEVTGVRSSARA